VDHGGRRRDPHRKEARSALAALCENYWYPLYALPALPRGYAADQARNVMQDFFIRVLALSRPRRPGKGRFRSFLLTSLKFLCH
jgi:RNA polymerase sigma-70 factor (ECF subfamily)